MVRGIGVRQGRQDTTVCLATLALRGVEMLCNVHWQPYGCWGQTVTVVPVKISRLFRELKDTLK